MSRIEKIEQQLRNNQTNVKISDLKKILIHYGFIERDGKGSHINFLNPKLKDAKDLVTIPIHGDTVRSIYVKKALAKIDKLKDMD
ncbi:type II toxin-antitoxin system HicA family toxin [Pseudoramibacter alactolyticus]|uniref:type II toxin-antitoxin system HicA family toxin n=1 Tax=Pseudoramibacter alactolyticus TaxID=113287 RepID=UPI0028EC0185|nr:type II toxin-antitoxin system HicA family toxin [Pseudoramibacter alactolyticus]